MLSPEHVSGPDGSKKKNKYPHYLAFASEIH